MRKSTIFLLGLAGAGAVMLLHWCTEPEEPGEHVRPPKLTDKAVSADDARLKYVRSSLPRRSKLGQDELRLWQNADQKLAGNPNDSEALYARANLMLSNHLLEFALHDANKLINIEPDSARAYCLRGQIYEESGDHDQALESFRRAILNDPDCGDAYYKRARFYFDSGRPWLAATDLERCKRAKFLPSVLPGRVNASPQSILYDLGRAYEEINRKDAALDAYHQYIDYIDKQTFGEGLYDHSYEKKSEAKARIKYIVPDVLAR